MDESTIPAYTRVIRENNIRKGFRRAAGGPGPNTFGDYIALAHSELSEALEAYRDHRLSDATSVPGPCVPIGTMCGTHDRDLSRCNMPPKPEGVGSELADVMIRVMDMADVFGIDLDYEIQRKIAYNATRPYRHGERVLADGAMQAPITRNE